MLMMITSSFMTLGTWVMYFMATWKLNNSESSNFPPNAKSFIVAVLELSQGIKGHPGRRNVCFNPPHSGTAWSWATCLVAARHPQRAREALVAAQSRPKKHQMTAAQWAADQSCPKSRPRCQLLDKKQTKAIWMERRGRMALSLEHLTGNRSRSRLSNAKSGVSKPSPCKAPVAENNLKYCRVCLIFFFKTVAGSYLLRIYIFAVISRYS